MGLRDGLAADAACAGVRAVAVVVEISGVGRAVMRRNVTADRARAVFPKGIVVFRAVDQRAAGAGPLMAGFVQLRRFDLAITGAAVLKVAHVAVPFRAIARIAVLFKGTIRQNLLWGNDSATDSDLWEALTVAQAKEVVEGKENGLDAPVEQGGVNFSGGQRQRLTIARALVRKPRILILDDSASALDYATDAGLRMAIRRMDDPPTTFIVSQRAASVRYADEILVLDDGILAGKGTHDELLASCPVYQEIYYSQFPKEAVQNG